MDVKSVVELADCWTESDDFDAVRRLEWDTYSVRKQYEYDWLTSNMIQIESNND